MLTALAALIGLALGAGVATALLLLRSGSRVHVAEREAETIRREAQIEARELAVKLRAEVESEVQDRRAARWPRSRSGHRRPSTRSRGGRPRSSVASRASPTARRTSSSCRKSSRRLRTRRSTQLERVAGLTVAEAKHHLLTARYLASRGFGADALEGLVAQED